MSLDEAFELTDSLYRDRVMAETWGYPKPGTKYPIKLLVTHTDDGLWTTIRAEYPSDCGNSFFQEDMDNFIMTLPLKEGEVYRWEGYYLKFKNGNYRFSGKLTQVKI